VLSVGQESRPQDFVSSDRNRRIEIKAVPEPVLASFALADAGQPRRRNPAWTYMIEHPHGQFRALSSGRGERDPRASVRGVGERREQPRGPRAVAKTLLRTCARTTPAWLRLKLDTLAKTSGRRRLRHALPPHGEKKRMPSLCSRSRSWCAGSASS